MSAERPNAITLEKLAWYALVATVAIAPLAITKSPFATLPVTYTVFGLAQSAVLALGVALALTFWALALWKGQTKLVLSKSMVAFAAFGAWAVVATVAGYEPLRSLFGRSTGALSLWHIATYLGLFFVVTQLVDSRQRIVTLTESVVLSATLVALIALLQQLFHADIFQLPVEGWMVGRGYSTIGNPDQLGTFLVLPVLLSFFLSLTEETKRRRIVALTCFAVLLTALTGTLTRGAWIAVAFGCVVALTLVYKSSRDAARSPWSLAVVAVALVAVLIALAASDQVDLASRFKTAPAQGPAVESTLDVVNTATSDRINLWRSSLAIVAQRPLTGTGPMAFELGWYPNAIDPSSSQGGSAIAEDPHSLVFYALATMGAPGLIAYLAAVLVALLFGAKTAMTLVRNGPLSAKEAYYVAWFVAAAALQIALLVAAVSTPIVMYSFIALAVLLRPASRSAATPEAPLARHAVAAVAALVIGLALVGGIYPNLAAESALGRTLRDNSMSRAQSAALSVPWNLDVQRAYYYLRFLQVNALLAAQTEGTPAAVDDMVRELTDAGAHQPREYYYPSLEAQLLTRTSESIGSEAYANAAIEAADEALAIMPAAIPTRVDKALALSGLERYAEMADALAGYWQNETTSPYPGFLYAQALALSGSTQQADDVFVLLESRFPGDGSIDAARQQVESPPLSQP